MLHSARQSLMLVCCTVIALDIVLLLGGPLLLEATDANSDWLYSEFELEENEDSAEEKTLIQDAEFSVSLEVSHSSALLVPVDFRINESDRDQHHVSRGPPARC